MAPKYVDSAKAEEEAVRITQVAGQNFKEVVNSFRNCLQTIQNTRRMLEVDDECFRAHMYKTKWEQRREHLYEAADAMKDAIEFSLTKIGFALVESSDSDISPEHEDEVVQLETYHLHKLAVKDEDLSWCDRVCIHVKVEMESSLWCKLPPTILELVFARLPLHQIFQLRVLSKHWRSSLTSATFQSAFGATASRRFALIAGTERKSLWSFGTMERAWYSRQFYFLPLRYDVPIAGDGGLLCCKCPGSFVSRSNQDLQVYVCNPLTQAWKKLPLPSHVQNFNLVHLVTDKKTKQYTITVVDHRHSSNEKARVEVYDSTTNKWTTGSGIFKTAPTARGNFVYFKHYESGIFLGIRAYDKISGYTSIPISVPEDIFFSEERGFFPLAEYEGQIYMLRTELAVSGIWVLQGPNHEWEKVCSVPQPEFLKYYLVSLYVSADVIIIFGDRRIFHDDMYLADLGEPEPSEPENPYMWMLDRPQGKWIDMVDHELDIISFSEIMFELRLDATP